MKITKTVLGVLALALFGAIFASGAPADDWNKKTVMTFSQPVEIPGQILPAGTYTVKLVDLASERHIVQISGCRRDSRNRHGARDQQLAPASDGQNRGQVHGDTWRQSGSAQGVVLSG